MTTMDQFIRTVILLGSLALTMGEAGTVTCIVFKQCVLPCKSSYHNVIHWYNGKRVVHSFYDGADQLTYQDEAYKGRTALFTDQISIGNISLILRGVRMEDTATYKCYSSINTDSKEALISVNVKAPIQSVDIKITDNKITCSTNNIFPKPTISWNIDGIPQENITKDSQGLISAKSTLPIQPNQTTYICSFRSGDGQQTYNASLVQGKTEIHSGEILKICCPDSQGETGHLTLTFNDSSEVLSYNQTSPPINRKWKDADVRITHDESITLHNLDSAKHAGIYTCERTTAQSRQIMQTSVQINPGVNIIGIGVGVGVGVVVVLVITIIIAVVLYVKKRKKNIEGKKSNGEEHNGENERLKDSDNSESAEMEKIKS